MNSISSTERERLWPALPLAEWQDTKDTLHLWTQIVGKVKVQLAPPENHTWHVGLHVTATGLSTGPIPYKQQLFEIDFDFVDHELAITTSRGGEERLKLAPMSVADFYHEVMDMLARLGIEVEIYAVPNELPDPIPFADDETHASYDADAVARFFQILTQSDRIMSEAGLDFLGKRSPVLFWWGAFDLSVNRFSGRRAPEHPGGVPYLPDEIVQEAYSHELVNLGFWPGDGRLPEPAYFSYSYPEPDGFAEAAVEPDTAYYSPDLFEWVLPYEAVRTADDPDAALRAFLKTPYEAGATLGGWDREALERS